MYANLTHYTTYAIAEQLELLLTGHTSELGNSQPVTISREWSDEPAGTPPLVWLDTALSAASHIHLLGDDSGLDSSGNVTFGAVFQDVPVNFGVRTLRVAEADNLFDAIYAGLLYAVNPATNVRWCQECYVRRGVLPTDVLPGRKSQRRNTQFGGVVYEIEGTILVQGQLAVSVVYPTLTSINVLPSVTVSIPVGLG